MAGACEKDKHEMESTDQRSGHSHPDFTNYERSFKFTSLQVSAHSCLSEKFRMGAPQWKNAFNTFLHKIINLS